MIFKSVIDLQQTRKTKEECIVSMFQMISGLSIREACRMFKITKNQKSFYQKVIKPMAKPKNCNITLEELKPNMLAIKIVFKKINEFNEEEFK
jgi:hypothetical protein